jgi:hypothetical protein
MARGLGHEGPATGLPRQHPRYRTLVSLKARVPLMFVPASVAALVLGGCARDTWRGFIYPDKNNLTDRRDLGTYESVEECRASALRGLQSLSSVSAGDYECGLNCRTPPQPEEEADPDSPPDSDAAEDEVCERMDR